MNGYRQSSLDYDPVQLREVRAPLGSAHTSDADILIKLFQIIWYRKALVLGTVALLTALAGIVIFQLTPIYSAKTVLMIEARKSQVADLKVVIEGLQVTDETVNSEMEVIRSRALAEEVIDKLGLDQNPEFNRALLAPGWLKKLNDGVAIPIKEWIRSFSGTPDDANLSVDSLGRQERERIIDVFLEKLNVSSIRASYIINIVFESENPQTAASVANTLTDVYIADQLESKFDATKRAALWLEGRVKSLREKVINSERAVEDYRRKSGLLQGTQTTLTSQEITELNSQLVRAKGKHAAAKVRLELIRKYMSSNNNDDSVVEVLNSRLIQSLREQEAAVARKVADLSPELGERHRIMINARTELSEIRARIRDEVSKIVKGIANEARIAKAQQASLEQDIEALKENIASANQAEINLRALEREAQSSRLLLETLLSRFKEAQAQEHLQAQPREVRIISRAGVPVSPDFPTKRLLLPLAFIMSFFVGLSLVFATELLNRGFKSGEEIERHTGIPSLGLVPEISRSMWLSKSPQDQILEQPKSAFAESLRTLHTSILLSRLEPPVKRILITSVQPKEGKTTIAISLVRSLAKSGRRVLLIDADLRRPAVHKALSMPREPGLVDLLSQDATRQEFIRRDEATGAHVLTAGRATSDAPTLLSSDKMNALLVEVGQLYDLVVIDCAPVALVSDARILACGVDQTLLLVWWAKTSREAVVTALKLLRNSGAKRLGTLLTKVDMRRADLGYHHRQARRYFTG